MNYLEEFLRPREMTAREYESLAYKTIVTDLMVSNVRGIKRAVDLTYWSDEDEFARFGTFVPGNFYVFLYDGDKVSQGKNEYHDVVPVMLALGVGNDKTSHREYVYGLNFNLLPGLTRAVVLKELHDMDSVFFDTEIYKDHTKGKHVFSKVVVKALQPDGGVKFIKYISKKYNINKDCFAFRRYYVDNISKYRLVDVWQWKFIPFLEYKEGIRGAEIKKIQSENADVRK
jgi:hypothetical protein